MSIENAILQVLQRLLILVESGMVKSQRVLAHNGKKSVPVFSKGVKTLSLKGAVQRVSHEYCSLASDVLTRMVTVQLEGEVVRIKRVDNLHSFLKRKPTNKEISLLIRSVIRRIKTKGIG